MLGSAAVMTAAAVLGVSLWAVFSGSSGIPGYCRVTGKLTSYTIDPEQARNATTIAAVAHRLGLPDHAVTVALAAAFQESKLHNVHHGDRDSLGLFQQRPSQGWGSPSEVLNPVYATTAFYLALQRVPDWQSKDVTVAAQEVQRSAAPTAYAAWEGEARTLASVLTGEVPAGLACRLPKLVARPHHAGLLRIARVELGSSSLTAVSSRAHGWLVASWLVAHAAEYRITEVRYRNRLWTPARSRWTVTTSSTRHVGFRQ
jgi:hypothetical protein